MFKVTRISENSLEIVMSGKLDSEQMEIALDELVKKSEGIDHGQMLYDVVNFQVPSLAAIWLEMSHLPSMLGLMRKFEKAAVLTDENWLKKASEIEGALLPKLEIKAFRRDQRGEAEAWLSS